MVLCCHVRHLLDENLWTAIYPALTSFGHYDFSETAPTYCCRLSLIAHFPLDCSVVLTCTGFEKTLGKLRRVLRHEMSVPVHAYWPERDEMHTN